ncbi:MAG TPA: diguanylate cyclase [Spirochaetia bacterium]|nr:diguanylate cyclase [Spirochaetia bacterium]
MRTKGMVHLNQGVRKALNHLSPGRHLLTLYHGEDNRIELMATFLSQGISRGERCVFAGEKLSEEALHQFNNRLPELGSHLLQGRIILLPERLGGECSTAVGRAIRRLAAETLREGYTGLRLAAEMTWLLNVLPEPTAFQTLLEDLDSILGTARTTMLSQFREDMFAPELIYNVLKKHPVIVIGDGVFENPFYNPPDKTVLAFPAPDAATAAPAHPWLATAGHSPGATALPQGLSTLLDEFPDPLLISDGQQQWANIRLHTLLEYASPVKRDLLTELAGLLDREDESRQVALSDGRTFSFRRIRFSQISPLRLVMGRETTQMQTMALELGSAREAYSGLLEALPLGFLAIDRQGRIADANARTAGLLGCPREQILHRGYLELVHPLDRPKTALWLSGNGQGTKALEMRLACPRGECWVSARNVPSPSPDLKGIIWEDVNDRKRSEVLQLLNEELVTLQDRLQFLSTRDALTGLFNRQYFEEEIRRLQNPRFAPVSIIIIDVDGLKPINDHFGHPRGDELLQTAARVLKRPFRETDMVARIGGDEFAILLPQTPYELAQERRDEILKEVDRHNLDSEGPTLSLSVGVATSVKDGPPLEDTIKQADDDMYRFKLARSICAPVAGGETLTGNVLDGSLPGRRLIALASLLGRQAETGEDNIDSPDGKLLS